MTTVAVQNYKRQISGRVGHAIKCPICKRRLMDVNINAETLPTVEVQSPENRGNYDMELRCSSCKSYVGVRFR